jgi:hypothetical protein
MTWKQTVLVVANQTARSQELLGALRMRADRAPTFVQLVVPAAPLGEEREAATRTLEAALEQFRDAGLEADGAVGHPDPLIAVTDVWDPRRYDEIVVSTLPIGVSKWLHAGLPERIERVTGAVVTHVVSAPPGPELPTRPAPSHGDHSGLGPLSVLGWGRAVGR